MSSQAARPGHIPTKPLLRALAGERQDRPPFWLMRQAGRYLPEYREVRRQAGSFLELCHAPALATEVTLQPVRRFGMDGAILFADILLLPQALGQKLEFREGEGPVLEPVRDSAALARLTRGKLLQRLSPVFETVERVARALPAETALIGFAGAPWTVACYMVEGQGSRDFAAAKQWAYGDPNGFAQVIELLVDATADYLVAQVEAGAEAVQLFDTWAGLLPERDFQRWCVAPVRAIADRLKARFPGLPVIAFPRGAGAGYAGFAAAAGVDAVGLDTTVPVGWAAREVQGATAVQGNLDPLYLVAGGEAMAGEVRRIVAALNDGPYIFNLGHGIVPETPPEHVAALAEILRRWPESAA